MMALLTKHQILAADDKKVTIIEVPEWGGQVGIRVMNCAERDAYENLIQRAKDQGLQDFRTRFLVKVLCDEEGKRLYEERDVTELSQKSSKVLARLWDEAVKINALREESVEEAGKN